MKNTVKFKTERNHRRVAYTGHPQEDREPQPTSFYLALYKGAGNEYTVIPIKSWYTFDKDINFDANSPEEAEKLVSPA